MVVSVIASPVAVDSISVKRLRHGDAVELRWKPTSSDGSGLILYVVEGISVDSVTAHYNAATHWTLLTRVTDSLSIIWTRVGLNWLNYFTVVGRTIN